MSIQSKGTFRILPHRFKYPLFLLGLFVIIAGGVGGIKLGLGADEEVGLAAVGFLIMMLGIVLE
jgi:hypothetical protein